MLFLAAETPTTVLSGIIKAETLSGVLKEITGMLPVVIPVLVGFIALRKGISFVRGILASA